MFDQRKTQIIDLSDSEILKVGAAFKYTDSTTSKELVVKLISDYLDDDDAILMAEFRKLTLLSSEPEIASVYFLAKAKYNGDDKSCYIMEFVYGYDLDEFIESSPNIDFYNIFSLIKQIASGLEKAHHYDIFHNDLHNKNIRINTLGYVKLIDFLWRDSGPTKASSADKDINDFKRIVGELCAKCTSNEAIRAGFLNSYCQKIVSFTGITYNLNEFESVTFDLGLLQQDSLDILSKLLEESGSISDSDLLLRVIVFDNEDIPEYYIPPITDKEQGYLNAIRTAVESGKPLSLRYLDTRLEVIKHNLKHQFLVNLSPLKSLNLLDWSMNVLNQGQIFIGPYIVKIHISTTSKFALLRRANRLMSLLSPVDRTLEYLLLNTPVEGISSYQGKNSSTENEQKSPS